MFWKSSLVKVGKLHVFQAWFFGNKPQKSLSLRWDMGLEPLAVAW
jgi:hypothetical protein